MTAQVAPPTALPADASLARDVERSYRVHDVLEQAAAFERAGDFTGAIARAREAARFAPAGTEASDEVTLALDHLYERARAWRADIERRTHGSST